MQGALILLVLSGVNVLKALNLTKGKFHDFYEFCIFCIYKTLLKFLKKIEQ